MTFIEIMIGNDFSINKSYLSSTSQINKRYKKIDFADD